MRPVEIVSWNKAVEYCRSLTERERKAQRLPRGYVYRLPTEAEWEYCCRSGSVTAFCFGDDECGLGDYGWYRDNSDGQTHPVGQKKPNAWGLFDMHGNVMEWCLDVYGEFYTLTGMVKYRVHRGGSWHLEPWRCCSSCRLGSSAETANTDCGFRVVLAPAIRIP
jgi:formylglycine-generating enzyme required for sulfatase activity